jgi:hypothetical protein
MLRKDLAPHVLTASNCSQLISAFKYLGEMCEINQTGAWVGSIMSPSSGENHAFCGDTRYQAPDSFHRVTIRECASNPTSADAATGSGHVLDDDWLAERGPHALGHDARKRIDRHRPLRTVRPS